MAESLKHMFYVEKIVDYIKRNLCEEDAYILIDSPNSGCNKPLSMADGYVPDVYVNKEKTLIIGEAKTEEDALRSHSIVALPQS